MARGRATTTAARPGLLHRHRRLQAHQRPLRARRRRPGAVGRRRAAPASCVRTGDTVARLSGDEFGDPRGGRDRTCARSARSARAVVRAFNRPIETAERRGPRCPVSVGVAVGRRAWTRTASSATRTSPCTWPSSRARAATGCTRSPSAGGRGRGRPAARGPARRRGARRAAPRTTSRSSTCGPGPPRSRPSSAGSIPSAASCRPRRSSRSRRRAGRSSRSAPGSSIRRAPSSERGRWTTRTLGLAVNVSGRQLQDAGLADHVRRALRANPAWTPRR